MAVAGIDVGSLTTKAVILEGDQILGQCIIVTNESADTGAREALDIALSQAGIAFSDLENILSTGVGRKNVTFAGKNKTSPSCMAKGISWILPSARTAFEVGAESSTVIRLDQRGMVTDSIGSERCASGTGTFVEAMANLMQMPIEKMAQLSLEAKNRAEISNMCAIFAEQEVISHVHRVPPTPKADIICGIHGSMATRIVGLAKRIGVKPDVALCGGLARNVGFVREMEVELEQKVLIPENPQLVTALGAALSAQRKGGR